MRALEAPPAWPGSDHGPEKGFPNWERLLRKVKVSEPASKRVLIASHTGLHGAVVAFDSTLAASLKLRGVDVHYALCDGVLQGCLMANISDSLPPQAIVERKLTATHCKGCFNRGTGVFRGLGALEHRLSRYLTSEDYTAAEAWAMTISSANAQTAEIGGVPVGEHALAGTLRYFASGDLSREPMGEAVLRRYLEGGALIYHAFSRMLQEIQPDTVVLHHGIYSPQGIAAHVARKFGARVVTWVVAYRKNSFIFSHDDTYHHTLMDEPTSVWEGLELDSAKNDALSAYLASRSGGKEDWIYFHKDPNSSFRNYASQVGIDLDKPIVSFLTNVMWDAQLHYPQNAFPSMLDWIKDSISLLSKRHDLQGVIRIHPAEVRGAIPARQTLEDEIDKAFPSLPKNVFVIKPDDDVSTYELAAASNAVVIFGTKMGVELTPMQRPVIVAGEAWIRNKGLTTDATSRDDYAQVIQSLPWSETSGIADEARARKYAFHFFFRRMIPLPFVKPSNNSAFFNIDIESGEELKPGKWVGLDVVCNGITKGTPFIYPAEDL